MKCRHCGAVYARPAARCWLCGQDPSGELGAVAAAAPPVHTAAVNPAQEYSRSFTLATIFLVMTLVAVCMGVVVMAPGLGIALAIFSLPPFVRTGMLVQRRVAAGKSVTTGQKIGWFLGSLAAAVVVAVVVTVASVGTFCAVCLGAGSEAAIPVALIAAGVATILAIIGMTRWIRHRWQRDVRQR